MSTGILVLMYVCLKSYLRSEVWTLGFKTSVVTILQSKPIEEVFGSPEEVMPTTFYMKLYIRSKLHTNYILTYLKLHLMSKVDILN